MALIPTIIKDDWTGLNRIIRKLASIKLGPTASPTFAGLTLTALTATRLMAINGSKQLASTDLISWVAGTTNRVSVADDGDGSITLSTPQDIHTGASPTFAGLTLTALTATRLMAINGSKQLASTDLISWVAGTTNRVSVADDGDGSITLSTPQDIHTGASPTFAGLSIGTLSLAGGSITDSTGAISFGDENLTTTGNISITGASGLLDLSAATVTFDTNPFLKFSTKSAGATELGTAAFSGFNKLAGNHEFFMLVGNVGNRSIFSGAVDGDAYRRFITLATGQLNWGDGTVRYDTTLKRTGTGLLRFGTSTQQGFDSTLYIRNPTYTAGSVATLKMGATASPPSAYGVAEIVTKRTNSPSSGSTSIIFRTATGATVADKIEIDSVGVLNGISNATTLGAGVTTFAIASNIMTITGDAGTNTIATITGASRGTILTLIFVDGLVTITDDNTHIVDSIDLSAAFTSADDAVLQLVYDGTSWYEVSRSIN